MAGLCGWVWSEQRKDVCTVELCYCGTGTELESFDGEGHGVTATNLLVYFFFNESRISLLAKFADLQGDDLDRSLSKITF